MKNILIVLFGILFLVWNVSLVSGAQDSSQFFPIGLLCVDDPSDFQEVAAAGFNLVQSYRFEGIPPWGFTDAEALKYFDAAQRAGLRVLAGLPQEAVQVPKSAGKQDLAFIQSRVRALKDHPALWGWKLYDEPENEAYGRGETVFPANFNNVYNTVKQIDPLHPISSLPMGDIDDTYPYLGVDIMQVQYSIIPPGIYDYPWDKLENLPETHRFTMLTLASKAMPFIYLFQAYNLVNDPDMWPEVQERLPNAVGRYPTREEMRFMAYSGLILGAKGLIFVEYKDEHEDISRKKNPSQWQTVSSVASELKSLSPILLAPQSQIEVTAAPKTGFLLKDYEGKLYLIAVNSKEEKRTIKFTFSESPTAVKVFNEYRTIFPQKNSFTDDFVGYGVHVYELQLKYI